VPKHKTDRNVLGTFLLEPARPLTLQESMREAKIVEKRDSKQNLIDDGKGNGDKVKINIKQRVSAINDGETVTLTKVHRNFQWLGYHAGAVSHVPAGALAVLSGNFSGCWMMEFKKDGQTHIGHVGTVDSKVHESTVESKKAWNAFANENQGAVLRGFNPAAVWGVEDRPKMISGDAGPVIWGLITKDKLISIILYQGKDDGKLTDRYRIAGVKEVPSAKKHVLLAI
jgi:hypothetical protein